MITVKVDPKSRAAVSKLRDDMNATREALDDREKPLEKIKARQIKRWDANFTRQGNLYQPWAALAKSTLEDRKYLGYGPGPILVRTGNTRSHFVDLNEKGIIKQESVRWNMRDKAGAYPLTHELGRPNIFATMPRRRLWEMNEEDEEGAALIMEKWIDSIIKRYKLV